jgi:hypothetical protein
MRVTEAEWRAATDPEPMLQFLRRKASERKLRLFACACARAVWDLLQDERARNAVEVGEQYADRLTTVRELDLASESAWQAVDACPSEANYCAQSTVESSTPDAAADAAGHAAQDGMRLSTQSDLLRDIFGNPFRAVPCVEPAWLAWQDGTLLQLALAAYEQRRPPEGTLDPGRLGVLADALEDAGCTDAEPLGHLRGPGPHVRGCWAVDWVLGKS